MQLANAKVYGDKDRPKPFAVSDVNPICNTLLAAVVPYTEVSVKSCQNLGLGFDMTLTETSV